MTVTRPSMKQLLRYPQWSIARLKVYGETPEMAMRVFCHLVNLEMLLDRISAGFDVDSDGPRQ